MSGLAFLPGRATQSARLVSVAAIIAEVGYQMGLRRADIIGPVRTAPLTRARFAVAWLAREVTPASWHIIAHALGGRHHSTISSARRRGDALRQTDPAFRRLTDRLREHFRDLQED